MTRPDRLAEVFARLDRVTDPELDESVTELRFVTDVSVDEQGRVAVGFRLPTYWCAANFAFMMADDMRREILALDWVTGVDLHLGEHMYADKINAGIATGASFQDAFGADASGNLDELRRTFLVKAFQRRQDALLSHLLGIGLLPEAIVSLSLGALQRLPLNEDGVRLRQRYLERRPVVEPRDDPASRAFIDEHGRPIATADLSRYMQALKRVGINAEFNGAICRGLLAARFDEELPRADGEPTLLDFVRMTPREQPRVA